MKKFTTINLRGGIKVLHYFLVEKGSCVILLIAAFSTLLSTTSAKSTGWDTKQEGNGCTADNRGGKSTRGVIVSPNYPLLYPDNACYNWLITAKPGEIITISFSDLDIQSGRDGECTGDYVEIGPLPYSKLCGSIPEFYPPAYTSDREHVWIKFRSDDTVVRRGFSLTYIIGQLPSPIPCLEDEFTCRNGKCILSSWHCNGGDECGDKSDEENCTGIVKPTAPPADDCGEDKFACISADTKLLTCFLNYYKCNGRQNCESGKDEENCGDQVHCGGRLTEQSGSFTSPNFPENYPLLSDCEYIIHVQTLQTIQLRFDVFQLETGYDTDYVMVFDGKDENSDLIGNYFGKNLPPAVIESTNNKLFIKFHSDGTISQNGFNATYQVKGHCIGDQLKCGFGEYDCYKPADRCDGVWHCKQYGGDERGCGACKADEFSCGSFGKKCYSLAERCNGNRKCQDKSDEMKCTPELCGEHNGTFLCKNSHCIQESWQCDGQPDCLDKSDEENCFVTTRVVTAAVIGSLICGLLLVVALGCTCKLYALRMQEFHGPRFETPMTRIQSQFARRRAPPPYNEAMVTSRPFDEVQREIRERMQNESNQSQQQEEQNNTTTNSQQRNGHSSRNAANTATSNFLIATTTTSESECDSDMEPGQHVDISIATGCAAQWRRRRKRNRQNICPPSGGSTNDPNHDLDTASASVDSDMVSIDSNSVKPNGTGTTDSNTSRLSNTCTHDDSLSSDSEMIELPRNFVGNQSRGSISSEDSTTSDTRLLLPP